MSINPGYKSIWRNEEISVESGPFFKCPKCKGVLMEAEVARFKTRCKHCGKWVYVEKIENSEKA